MLLPAPGRHRAPRPGGGRRPAYAEASAEVRHEAGLHAATAMPDHAAARPLLKSTALRWALVAFLVALGVLLGYLASALQSEKWVATTSVLVLPTAGGRDVAATAGRGATDVQIETEAEVARSAQVAGVAAQALAPGTSPERTIRHLSVAIPPNTQVLELSYSADSAEGARDGSVAIAEAYLRRRSEAAAGSKAEVVAGLQGQLVELDKRLEDVSVAIATAQSADQLAPRTLAEAERGVLVEQIAEVNRRLAALRFETTAGGEIITRASTPTQPASPQTSLYLVGGLMVGLLAGAGVAFGGRPSPKPGDVTDEDEPLPLQSAPPAGAGTGQRRGPLGVRSRHAGERPQALDPTGTP